MSAPFVNESNKVQLCNDKLILIPDSYSAGHYGKAGTHGTYPWWRGGSLFSTYTGIMPVTCWPGGILKWRILIEESLTADGFMANTNYCGDPVKYGSTLLFTPPSQSSPDNERDWNEADEVCEDGASCDTSGGKYRGLAATCICVEEATTLYFKVCGPVENKNIEYDYCSLGVDGQAYAQIQGINQHYMDSETYPCPVCCTTSTVEDTGFKAVEPGLHIITAVIDSSDGQHHDMTKTATTNFYMQVSSTPF